MITRAHAALKKYTSWSQFFAQERSYRTLRAHYASAHWRPWFDQPPAQGERPRRQRWPAGCFFNWPPSEDVSSLSHYMYEEGCNFNLIISISDCWISIWWPLCNVGEFFGIFKFPGWHSLERSANCARRSYTGTTRRWSSITPLTDHHQIIIGSTSDHHQVIFRSSSGGALRHRPQQAWGGHRGPQVCANIDRSH